MMRSLIYSIITLLIIYMPQNSKLEDKKELENLYNRTWEAMIGKDTVTLDSLHADEFVLVHMTGTRQPKKEYIRSILNGTLNYYEESTDRILIEFRDDSHATVTGQSKVLAAVYGGGKNWWNLQLKFTAGKRDGQWVFTYCEASTYR